LQIAGQVLEIGIRLSIFAEGLGGGRLGSALQRLLKRRHRTLGRVQVAGLEGAANGLEILQQLNGAIVVGGGRHTSNTACHIRFRYVLVDWFAPAMLPGPLGNVRKDQGLKGNVGNFLKSPLSIAPYVAVLRRVRVDSRLISPSSIGRAKAQKTQVTKVLADS